MVVFVSLTRLCWINEATSLEQLKTHLANILQFDGFINNLRSGNQTWQRKNIVKTHILRDVFPMFSHWTAYLQRISRLQKTSLGTVGKVLLTPSARPPRSHVWQQVAASIQTSWVPREARSSRLSCDDDDFTHHKMVIFNGYVTITTRYFIQSTINGY